MDITEKQLDALKKFQKNEKLTALFNGIDIEELTKQEASGLIDQCIEKANLRRKNGKKHVALTEDEMEKIRWAHAQHCDLILKECAKKYPDDKDVQLAVFNKRCDKVFTWMQRALDGKN